MPSVYSLVLVMLHRQGDNRDPTSGRGISALCVCSRLIQGFAPPHHAEKEKKNKHFNFENDFIVSLLRMALQDARIMFTAIDIHNAYLAANREQLWKLFERLGINMRLIIFETSRMSKFSSTSVTQWHSSCWREQWKGQTCWRLTPSYQNKATWMRTSPWPLHEVGFADDTDAPS